MCRPENTNKPRQSVQQSDLHILYWSNKGGRGGVWEGRERRGSVRRDGGSVGREEGGCEKRGRKGGVWEGRERGEREGEWSTLGSVN